MNSNFHSNHQLQSMHPFAFFSKIQTKQTILLSFPNSKKTRLVSREFAFHSFVLYVFVLFFSLLFCSLSSLVDVSLKIWYHTSLYQSVNPFVHADLWRICLFFSLFLHYLFCHASTWWKHVVYNNDQFFFCSFGLIFMFVCDDGSSCVFLFWMFYWCVCWCSFFSRYYTYVCFAGENKWWNLERMNDDDDDDMRYAEF